MPTYARHEGDTLVERTVTEAGSLEDLRLSAATTDESSGWSVLFDESDQPADPTATAEQATGQAEPARADAEQADATPPAGRTPRGPRSSSSSSSTAAEGTDG